VRTVNLGVKLNDVFGSDVGDAQMVRRAANAGGDAVGYWPWYDDLDDLVEAADDAGVDISCLSGGGPTTEGPEFPLIDPESRERAIGDVERAIDVTASVGSDCVNVIPGRHHEPLDPAEHHVPVVNALRRVADRAERTA